MNQSLAEPDYLSCSITRTAPLRSIPKQKRSPALAQARLNQRGLLRLQPMAARVNQFNPAAEGIRRPDIGDLLYRDANMHKVIGADGHAGEHQAESDMAIFNPSLLPDPPVWIARFISNHLKTLPYSTEDDAVLTWLRTLKEPFLRAARKSKPHTPAGKRKEKMTNAERFRLQLPPVAPKEIRERPNKPAPFRIPGIEYTDEEMAAMGWKEESDAVRDVESAATVESRVWLSVLLAAMTSEKSAEAIRKDVLEAVWQLLDFVADAQEVARKGAEQKRANAKAAKAKAKAKAGAAPMQLNNAKDAIEPAQRPMDVKAGLKAALPQVKKLAGQKQAHPNLVLNRKKNADGRQEVTSGLAEDMTLNDLSDKSDKEAKQRKPGQPRPLPAHPKNRPKPGMELNGLKMPDEHSHTEVIDKSALDTQMAEETDGNGLESGKEPQSPLDVGVLSGLRAMLDAKEKELSDLRTQIDALGKHWQNVVPVKVGSSPADLMQEKAEQPFAPEQASLDPFEEHLRLSRAKQAQEKEKKVQPELSLLESEDVLAGAAAINQGKRPAGVQFVKPGPRE